MEKLFEKIGDHFNNPEMSDRILVVKIRTDGWEKLEAARRVKNMTKTSSDNNEDSSSPTNDKSAGNTNVRLEEKQPVTSDRGSDVPYSCVEEGITFGNVDSSSSRTVSSLSCDSGVSCETLPSEAKRTVKSKKREDSLTVVENRESVARDNLDAEKTSDSNDASTSSTVSSPELDLDIAYTKLLLTDIGYANKAGAIGLTGASNSSLTSGENEVNKTAADNGVLKAREEDLVLADTVIREHQLCVHSFWLALNSSYFRSLFFSSGMKETKVKKVGSKIPRIGGYSVPVSRTVHFRASLSSSPSSSSSSSSSSSFRVSSGNAVPHNQSESNSTIPTVSAANHSPFPNIDCDTQQGREALTSGGVLLRFSKLEVPGLR